MGRLGKYSFRLLSCGSIPCYCLDVRFQACCPITTESMDYPSMRLCLLCVFRLCRRGSEAVQHLLSGPCSATSSLSHQDSQIPASDVSTKESTIPFPVSLTLRPVQKILAVLSVPPLRAILSLYTRLNLRLQFIVLHPHSLPTPRENRLRYRFQINLLVHIRTTLHQYMRNADASCAQSVCSS